MSGSIFLNRNQAALAQITTPEMAETGMQQGKGQEADVGWTCGDFHGDFWRFGLANIGSLWRKLAREKWIKNGGWMNSAFSMETEWFCMEQFPHVSATFSAKFSWLSDLYKERDEMRWTGSEIHQFPSRPHESPLINHYIYIHIIWYPHDTRLIPFVPKNSCTFI